MLVTNILSNILFDWFQFVPSMRCCWQGSVLANLDKKKRKKLRNVCKKLLRLNIWRLLLLILPGQISSGIVLTVLRFYFEASIVVQALKIARLTIVAKGKNFLTRICKSNRVSIR